MFKELAMKGNVVDVAVGLVIGAAFGKIVASLVKDVMMPPIGLLMGKIDFSNLIINLGEIDHPSLAAAEEAGAPVLKYGVFIMAIIDFLIVTFTIFMVVKAMNKMKRTEEEAPAAPPEPSKEEVLLGEIRDLLAQE
ncbi:MAG: large-conductance mechanosensitive channel protein MscL [bacterium]|nr:large-conductance mechanosensitive channel protein MscL [bacterium]